ncbi:MAG: hypothetical protein H7Z12_17395 [Rhodospirillaceae bacterium]|nr:hypothetical protein [Rhodospirillales bacterium]
MDETKITGALPNMTVEITHGTADDGSAEHLTIHLTATPNLQSALPLFGGLLQLPLMMGGGMMGPGMMGPGMMGAGQSPFAFWAQVTQALMAPWTNLAQASPWTALLSGDILGKGKK